MFEMALSATANQAWKCAQDWKGHPLTKGRLKPHLNLKNTRQGTCRQYPPQSLLGSLVHCMVEVWERLPTDITEETNPKTAKRKIKSWSQNQTF